MFRAVAARGNYLGQDRMDMQFAAKEISRFMSKPEEQDWRSAKRLARYLKDNRRVVIMYKYQKLPWKVIVWSDSDFAGCQRTGRSTSGGVVDVRRTLLEDVCFDAAADSVVSRRSRVLRNSKRRMHRTRHAELVQGLGRGRGGADQH